MEIGQNVVPGEEPKKETTLRAATKHEHRGHEEELDLFPFGANPGITFGRD